MSNNISEELKAFLNNDEIQLEIVGSNDKRILVEAPAGCGKTKILVAKLVHIIKEKHINYPKKILCLTFSVNAAHKIKKDINENTDIFFRNKKISFNEFVKVTNYHGLCRQILGKYGYLIHENLRDISNFEAFDDSDRNNILRYNSEITEENLSSIMTFSRIIKKEIEGNYSEGIDKYNENIIQFFITNKRITFSGIITITIHLLKNYPEIKKFYNNYFSYIVIDEYQDTNILGTKLLTELISEDTNLIFLGDSLQRIYGFIGAIKDLINTSESHFRMKKYKLEKNYRFKDNPQMLLLDRNIRRNAENINNPQIEENSLIELNYFTNYSSEAKWIVNESTKKLEEGTIAILTKQRNRNFDEIIQYLNKNSTPYFYALFSDDDPYYIQFHHYCTKEFLTLLDDNNGKINKALLSNFIKIIETKYNSNSIPAIQSVLELLRIFINGIFTEYSKLSIEEKKEMILETLNNKLLKSNIEFIKNKIILSTVHGAKGLEWDFVFLPDMEKNNFPNYYGLCKECSSLNKTYDDCVCIRDINEENTNKIYEELSVFYVAITRARKNVIFSSSQTLLDAKGKEIETNISCLLYLKGIKVKYIKVKEH